MESASGRASLARVTEVPMMRTSHVVLVLALLGSAAACERTAHARYDPDTGRVYTYEERTQFREDMERRIDDLEAKLAKLKEKAASSGEKAGEDVQQALADARRKLAELGSATRENWNEFTRKFSESLEDLEHRIDR